MLTRETYESALRSGRWMKAPIYEVFRDYLDRHPVSWVGAAPYETLTCALSHTPIHAVPFEACSTDIVDALVPPSLRGDPGTGLPLSYVTREPSSRFRRASRGIHVEPLPAEQAWGMADSLKGSFAEYLRNRAVDPDEYLDGRFPLASYFTLNGSSGMRFLSSGSGAVAAFSVMPGCLYWDFTIHDGDPSRGNAILCAAYDLATLMGLPLCLGIAWLDWKRGWDYGDIRFHPSIRPQHA